MKINTLTNAQTGPAPDDLDLKMMRMALDQARLAWDADEVPVGAVIYRGQEIISAAFNLRESVVDPTAHAEIVALREAARKLGDWRMNDCTMAVTLEPCPMCAGALVNARVGRLVYGASDPKWGAVRSMFSICSDKRLNHRLEIFGDVMGPECQKLLRDFFKMRRQANKDEKPDGTGTERKSA